MIVRFDKRLLLIIVTQKLGFRNFHIMNLWNRYLSFYFKVSKCEMYVYCFLITSDPTFTLVSNIDWIAKIECAIYYIAHSIFIIIITNSISRNDVKRNLTKESNKILVSHSLHIYISYMLTIEEAFSCLYMGLIACGYNQY